MRKLLASNIMMLILLLTCCGPGRHCDGQTTRPVRAQAPDSIRFDRDIVYGKGGDQDLELDLARPKKSDRPVPCILVIHGGGWSSGTRQAHDDVTWLLAQAGYVSATVEYRLAPAHPFPAQIEDVKCAVRFLRANAAEYGIDPDRIGAMGFSAGAHLAMMLGTTSPADHLEGDGGSPQASSKVQAVVSFFGPTDFAATDLPVVSQGILKTFIGGRLADKSDAYAKASPITHVSSASAPMLLFQGTNDPLIPATQAFHMAEAMTRAGVDGRVELLVGLGHGWGNPELKRTADASLAFFKEKFGSEK